MKPELGRIYPPTWRGIPAHMARRDLPLWYRFLDKAGATYQGFFYDVALGDGSDPGPEQPTEFREGWIRLTRLRADAVGIQPDAWTLFEARPNAGAGALGAIVAYRAFWLLDPPDNRPLRAILVTDRMRPDIQRLFTDANIAVLTL